jgi:hypothetical protein
MPAQLDRITRSRSTTSFISSLLQLGCCLKAAARRRTHPGAHVKATMSKLAMLRTGVVAAGAARGVVSPVFGHSQVAVDTAEESDAAQVAQKPRKVPTFLANISCTLSDSARPGSVANLTHWAARRMCFALHDPLVLLSRWSARPGKLSSQ